MVYFLIIILVCFFVVIVLLINNYNKGKLAYQIKIISLEKTIGELNKSLELQTQKVKLSDDLRNSLKGSNKTLSTKIVDMNMEMFGEMFSKNIL